MVTRVPRKVVQQRLQAQSANRRFQHELKEMQETRDLRQIDDDVEEVATLVEWHAPEHEHRPKPQRWFMTLAAALTVMVGVFAISANFIAIVTTALVGGLIYVISQHRPPIMRYRIMVDGAAVNNTLYHFKDLKTFNIIYEPGETKAVLLRSKKFWAPLLHLEIGEMDPVIIRDVLLEFLPEDQTLEEPAADVWARRLGF